MARVAAMLAKKASPAAGADATPAAFGAWLARQAVAGVSPLCPPPHRALALDVLGLLARHAAAVPLAAWATAPAAVLAVVDVLRDPFLLHRAVAANVR